MARHGEAGHGLARRGGAGLGGARLGGLCGAWRGLARLGTAWHGEAGLGDGVPAAMMASKASSRGKKAHAGVELCLGPWGAVEGLWTTSTQTVTAPGGTSRLTG